MNIRKGLYRLAIAIGVPYFGFWGLVAFVQYGRYNDPYGSPTQQSSASEILGLALWWGLILPLLLVTALAIGYWVYRGFKSGD